MNLISVIKVLSLYTGAIYMLETLKKGVERMTGKRLINIAWISLEDLLNQLAEENEQLKKENKRLQRCINEIYTIARLEEM